MTTFSLPELLEGINQQIQSQDALHTYLQQANALTYIGETSDFDQIGNEIVHHYLGVLMDILEKANQLSEHLSEGLCSLAKTLKIQS